VCVAPHGLALSRGDGNKAFVACYGEDAVAIVDLAATHTPVVRVPLSPGVPRDPPPGPPRFGPYAVSLSPSGARLAVSNREAKDVRFLDVPTAKMETLVVPLSGSPYFSAWSTDGARVYVPTRAQDALTVFDAKTGRTLGMRLFDAATCVQPLEAIVTADKDVVFVVCEGSESAPGVVLTLDATTLATQRRAVVGRSPGRAAVGRGR
jgi:DNA-binding beta-propeller fold protein YncE